MQRVVILGRGGAGKSTLARRLGELVGLPVIELDKHFWQPGLVPLISGKVGGGAVQARKPVALDHVALSVARAPTGRRGMGLLVVAHHMGMA